MTIKDNLNQIKTYKTDIKNAIINKGISMTGVPLSGYASKITAISGDYIDVRNKLGDYYYSTTKTIPECTFVGCYNLKSISFPNCTTIGSSAFESCYNLSKGGLSFVSLPKCKNVHRYAFDYCRSIYYADLPVCTYIGSYAFRLADKMSYVNIPKCNDIRNFAFIDCKACKTISLSQVTSVTKLNNSNAFYNCKSLTSIYVPQSLVTSFKSATNWTYFSSKIVPWVN